MPDKIANYELGLPTRQEAIGALSRLLGDTAALQAWSDACARVGVSPNAEQLSLEQLLAIAEQLGLVNGLASVAGNSLWVKLTTYKALCRLRATRGGTP